MSRTAPRRGRERAASPARAGRERAPVVALLARHERLLLAILVGLHVVLAVWAAARNSVTFDENFHLPAGVMTAARGELRISAVNPPLVKALAGAAALAAGARLPSDAAIANGEQGVVGESFMRANADRYHRVFLAGRLVVIALSGLLALAVGWLARAFAGAAAGVLAVAFYVFAPEALAHGSVVTMDVPTALGFVVTLGAWRAFVRGGRWAWWAIAAIGLAFTFLVRFTAVFLPPLLVALALVELAAKRVRRPRRLAIGFALFALTTLVAMYAGYLGHVSFDPLRAYPFQSESFRSLAARFPDLRSPLPDAWLAGFDRQAVESQMGRTPSYLNGRIHDIAPLSYFPIALAVKWPLGFLGALLLRLAWTFRAPFGISLRARGVREALWLAAPVALFLFVAMFVGKLGIGIRYVFPILPFLCIALGGLASRVRASRAFAWMPATAAALALVQAIESGAHLPYPLSFYNSIAGGPARGQWIVNDSNVDWGEGLIALRDELRRRGIGRVHLAYHGTTDPAVYGIDYVPYRGGMPGPESEWIAISSYYFVGLSQRMMTREGRTADALKLDFRPLWSRTPTAMPAGCMVLFRLR